MAMLIVMRVLGGGAAASVQAVGMSLFLFMCRTTLQLHDLLPTILFVQPLTSPGAGSVADIWEVRERGRAMGIFYLGPLLGPLLAPIIGIFFDHTLHLQSTDIHSSGGALAQAWGWRSTRMCQISYQTEEPLGVGLGHYVSSLSAPWSYYLFEQYANIH